MARTGSGFFRELRAVYRVWSFRLRVCCWGFGFMVAAMTFSDVVQVLSCLVKGFRGSGMFRHSSTGWVYPLRDCGKVHAWIQASKSHT